MDTPLASPELLQEGAAPLKAPRGRGERELLSSLLEAFEEVLGDEDLFLVTMLILGREDRRGGVLALATLLEEEPAPSRALLEALATHCLLDPLATGTSKAPGRGEALGALTLTLGRTLGLPRLVALLELLEKEGLALTSQELETYGRSPEVFEEVPSPWWRPLLQEVSHEAP